MVMDAPADLALVQRLVNTADLETGSDDLGDTDALAAWLASAGLAAPEERFDEAGRARIVELREALRALLLANHGERPDRRAVAALDRAARLSSPSTPADAPGWRPPTTASTACSAPCSRSSPARRPTGAGSA